MWQPRYLFASDTVLEDEFGVAIGIDEDSIVVGVNKRDPPEDEEQGYRCLELMSMESPIRLRRRNQSCHLATDSNPKQVNASENGIICCGPWRCD